MNTISVLVTKIEEKPCMFGIFNLKPTKYSRVHHVDIGKCLYIEGIDEQGNSIHCWTPQAIIRKTTGMIYGQTLVKNTGGFFRSIDGDTIGHKSPFNGDTIMPVVIEDTTKIEPSIEVGQTYMISFKNEERKFDSRRLKIVRLLS